MRTKVIGVLLCLVASYVVACTIEADVRSILADVLLPFAGALTGMILATVGIIMGSVGSIYSAVAARHTQESAQRVREALGKLDDMVKELREDCLIVVIGFVVLLVCYLFSRMDLPGVAFPDCAWMDKSRAIITVSVLFTMLSLWGICDTVGAVFTLHRHAAEIARDGK